MPKGELLSKYDRSRRQKAKEAKKNLRQQTLGHKNGQESIDGKQEGERNKGK
jgi:hypothetical protein